MSVHTLLHVRVRRLLAVGALLGVPLGAAALVSSVAGASTTTFTGTGTVTNPCTSITESLQGPTIITLMPRGNLTLVSFVWEGKTSGGDTFVISGKESVPTSNGDYVIPIQETFAGRTGTFRGPGTVKVSHSGAQPTGDAATFGPLTCLSK